jgi:hypothetical protein
MLLKWRACAKFCNSDEDKKSKQTAVVVEGRKRSFTLQKTDENDPGFPSWFLHPNARIFTAMFVTVADMVVYSEDPMAHSRTEANVPGGCNAVTFVARCEPPSCPTPNTH